MGLYWGYVGVWGLMGSYWGCVGGQWGYIGVV